MMLSDVGVWATDAQISPWCALMRAVVAEIWRQRSHVLGESPGYLIN